jgi:hypothetical protein
LHFQLAMAAEPEYHAETADISSSGICILTDRPPMVGSVIEVCLKIPEMITGKRAAEWRITGHVVHVQESSLESGKYGVGVQFDCYEVRTAYRAPSLTINVT